ncbi:MAG TPA: PD-(D/E)XK motif protein [bacterium]|nr:PD-(D/E)XK motif protein [bacterium]
MKISPEILERQWSNVRFKSGGFLQVDTLHPLEWYIGYQSIDRRMLSLVCDTEIGAIESSKSIIVSRRRRESDNRWTLSFELLRNDQQGVFSTLCCDIIEHSRTATNGDEALKLVINRFKQWSKLLEVQKSALMDEHSRKGLLGELLFLEERLRATDSAIKAIQGWTAPEKAAQDFSYSDGWYEVKSIGTSVSSVKISSLEQLANSGTGELIVMRIDRTTPERAGAISLNDIVGRIAVTLNEDTEALDLFRSKLNTYGYIDLQEYSEPKYLWTGEQSYHVDEAFPRITKANVPVQVVSAVYELDLPSLSEWRKV